MNCLLTYEELKPGEKFYSAAGLKKLNPKLKSLKAFPYTQEEQLKEARKMATKISIQGVQPKISVQLSLTDQSFQVVDKGGTYIVKPQTMLYPELPENEDVTMKLANLANIQVPWHGLIRSEDETLSYVIKRFDRKGHGQKVSQEDLAQLMGASRTTKYEASMEKVAELLNYCTFPTLEGLKLFRRLVFSFLVGNEDMHLKNFSVYTDGNQVKLTPAYDLVNTTIAMESPQEELALSLRERKRNFKKTDFLSYATEDLFIVEKKAVKEIQDLLDVIPKWTELIDS